MLLDLLRETPHDEWCEIPRRMSFHGRQEESRRVEGRLARGLGYLDTSEGSSRCWIPSGTGRR